jgi:hypothetical protein
VHVQVLIGGGRSINLSARWRTADRYCTAAGFQVCLVHACQPVSSSVVSLRGISSALSVTDKIHQSTKYTIFLCMIDATCT